MRQMFPIHIHVVLYLPPFFICSNLYKHWFGNFLLGINPAKACVAIMPIHWLFIVAAAWVCDLKTWVIFAWDFDTVGVIVVKKSDHLITCKNILAKDSMWSLPNEIFCR